MSAQPATVAPLAPVAGRSHQAHAERGYASDYMTELQARLNVFRARWNANAGYRRFATKAEAKAALESVAEVVATIGLALPLGKSRMVSRVLDELEAIVGAPKC